MYIKCHGTGPTTISTDSESYWKGGGGTVLTASTPIYSPSHVVTGGWAATEDNLHMLF